MPDSARPRTRARSTRPVIDATPGDVVAALEAAGRPLTARELRTALRLPADVFGMDVTRLLHRAVRSGSVALTGRTAGTRYHAIRDR